MYNQKSSDEFRLAYRGFGEKAKLKKDDFFLLGVAHSAPPKDIQGRYLMGATRMLTVQELERKWEEACLFWEQGKQKE